jgi:predicted glycoside hydrolase/deacetylase ChbG (UPF0249 family)
VKPLTRIVLNADDFGLSPGINAAILDLLRAGRLSGVSAMTTSPLWQTDGPRLAPFSTADIGLHFTLRNFTFAQALVAAWTGRIRVDAVLAELRDQWRRFREVLGRAPSHLDSHQYVHQLPGVRDAVLAFLDGLPPAERPYVRTCVERPRVILERNVNNGRALACAWAGARLARDLRQRGIATNDGYSGVYDFSGADYRAKFQRFISHVRERTIVVCHPGDGDAPEDPIGAARRREYGYLSSNQMPADLVQGGVRLGRFDAG